MTAADRPSVTDNARAEADAEAIRLAPVDDVFPSKDAQAHYRCGFRDGAEWAAGRAETSTWCNCQAIPGSQNYPGPWHERGGESHYPCAETTTGAIARGEALAAGDPDWSNVTRRAETTTATVATDAPALLAELERAQEREADAVQRAERAEALLDTAHTRPTREQIREALSAWDDADAYEAADAVLALLGDQPTEAEAGARALSDFTDATRFPSDWILFRRDDGSGVSVSDLLRETAANYLQGPEED